MSDIVSKRSTALDRLLQEFDRPPPVPPKDDRRILSPAKTAIADSLPLPKTCTNLEAYLGNRTSAGGSMEKEQQTNADELGESKKRADSGLGMDVDAPVKQVVTTRRKKVAFAANDDMLSPPPMSLQKDSFEDELCSFELHTNTSVFDPPPAPRFSRFPDRLPDAPKRKPAPLNLNRPTSQTGKWKVRVESDVWTPIDDEPDTASIISMEVRNAPRICPLPYKPIKSVPLKARGSLRPAPLRIRKGVRFDNVKSPAHLPMKSPAIIGKKVRFDNVKSPSVSRFRTPPTPFSSSQFAVLTPGRKRGVRFAAVKSPAASSFKTPPTPYYTGDGFREALSSPTGRTVRFGGIKSPAASKFKTPPTPYYHRTSFRVPASSFAKRNVRFDSIRSPAVSKFKTPPTPYYSDSFADEEPDKAVRFSSMKSPASSSFKSPPTQYNKNTFHEPASPTDYSPVTPRAMHMSIPAIEPDSPPRNLPAQRPETMIADEPAFLDPIEIHAVSKAKPEQSGFPPRSTSLPHRRNASLPKILDADEVTGLSTLPATTFDENAVGESTLRWLGMLPKSSYRIGPQNQASDRNQILGSYFHRSTPSF